MVVVYVFFNARENYVRGSKTISYGVDVVTESQEIRTEPVEMNVLYALIKKICS